ncbi:hypothetical protein I6F35_02610 [Bradyrhizobium sp. BRP22]|uniref:hypothetical protein n=1 Tax=Bradyrhizobium sp. BRP22 TaxID=2793821 RepID=UPI001CD786FA|nr:hypothetical protein [Bradyrhizobium sp. BRP22]MCA1452105.1 hypothetical protein [Bradyrhizobium sp. BRP22]
MTVQPDEPNQSEPPITPQVRRVLERRSALDKVAVPRSGALLHHDVLPAISWLVRYDYLVWITRTDVSEYRIDCDIYQLTSKGIRLCQSNDVPQR